MVFNRRGGLRLFLVGGMLIVLSSLPGVWSVAFAQGQVVMPEGPCGMESDRLPQGAGSIQLAEMVQREDSVIYRTDSKDSEYQKRQREERDKEKKSWEMLNNVIIDGRQPPRRFSDPRGNDYPQ
jgi:hypothetical protein